MKSWFVTVLLLFAVAKTLLWIKGFILPLPVYVLAGAFLAIASNYDRGIVELFRPNPESIGVISDDVIRQTASLVEETPLLEATENLESN